MVTQLTKVNRVASSFLQASTHGGFFNSSKINLLPTLNVHYLNKHLLYS